MSQWNDPETSLTSDKTIAARHASYSTHLSLSLSLSLSLYLSLSFSLFYISFSVLSRSQGDVIISDPLLFSYKSPVWPRHGFLPALTLI